MRVLYIGGTGEISLACVNEAARAGHEVTVFNRGLTAIDLPSGIKWIGGERTDRTAYAGLAEHNFDVVCQFLAFDAADAASDVETFAGHCGQFIFVSSASVYHKPIIQLPIDEATPVGNRFSAYSAGKLACEALYLSAHREGRLPVTIVRPSHTYRHRLPSTIVSGDHLAWRLQNGKPVAVHGDGLSVWTLTHAEDFARAFVALCGLDAALGQCVNVTGRIGHTWMHIIETIADAIGVTPDIQPILTSTLVASLPELEATLPGDKANSLIFDTGKVSQLTGGWQCEISLQAGIRSAWPVVARRLVGHFQPDLGLDATVDTLIDQARRGAANISG